MTDKKKILIVDDEAGYVALLKERLAFEGFEVHQAFDGAACLELMRRGAFDVVLLDLMMPGIDGFEVLRTIQKEGGALARIPIIVVTAYGREFLEDELKVLGRVLFVRKPFEPKRLLEMIRETIAQTAGDTRG